MTSQIHASSLSELGESFCEQACDALSNAPGVGVSICTLEGKVLHANDEEIRIYFGADADPADYGGEYDLRESLHSGWAEERLGYIRRAHAAGRPLRVRSMWKGWQLVTRIQPLPDDAVGVPSCLLVTNRISEIDPADGEPDLATSSFVGLGPLAKLSPRELEVVSLIGRGLPTRNIAEKLELSPKTVEKHRDAIVRKVDEKSRIRLAIMARNAGLGLPDARREKISRNPND